MANLPNEFLDGMAEFAAGIRDWNEWGMWFAIHAGRLVRVMDRGLFEQLKRQPKATIGAVLQQEQVTIRPAAPPLPHLPNDVISSEEYEVYTALTRQLDLFVFNRPDTIFEDQTAGDSLRPSVYGPRLVFDETQREYRVVQPEFAERFSGSFHQWFVRYPEMFRQYEDRNRRGWLLEKRFEVENGYRLTSELRADEEDLAQGAFCLSRVGFSSDGQFALVFIRYAVCCSYYLVFERSAMRWERVEFRMAWVT